MMVTFRKCNKNTPEFRACTYRSGRKRTPYILC